MKIISLIGVILFSMSAMSADFTIDVNPAANSIDDSKVSSLSISKITNLQSSLDAKANQSSVDSALALKADSSSVSSSLALKADQSAVTSALALKADQSAVTSALALKANSSSLGSLAAKSTITNSEVADGALSSSKIASFASDVISAMASSLSNYLQKADIPNCSAGQFLTKTAGVYSCVSAADTNPVGTVITYTAGNGSCPSGYLMANGASYPVATYPSLYSVLGVSHGGTAGVSFNVPDYRGRFLRMLDGNAGRDPDKNSRSAMNSGGASGNNVGSVQGQATAKNGLSIIDPGHNHNEAWTNGSEYSSGLSGGPAFNGKGITQTIYNFSSNVYLNNGDNETRPQNAYVMFCIKY